ncbi:hypothetical protein LZ31DRAFT_550238 [Colletotrichum somersetense]|nr:hypothetical protein LZ31DRAFT_550238 [Colletotrichum somersetense]
MLLTPGYRSSLRGLGLCELLRLIASYPTSVAAGQQKAFALPANMVNLCFGERQR